jgi:hypothetical protein
MFRGLMFESEAEAFRRAGIQIGASSTEAEDNLLREALAPFGGTLRNNALEMARLRMKFVILLETRLLKKRDLIGRNKLPPKIKEQAESRRDIALNDSWLEGDKTDLLGFVDFGHLARSSLPSGIILKMSYQSNIGLNNVWTNSKRREISLRTIECCYQASFSACTCTSPIGIM